MSAPRYEISTCSDFHTVPADRLGECLLDFRAWIDETRLLASILDPNVVSPTGTFIWVDDGERGVSGIEVRPMDDPAMEDAQ